MYRLRYINSRKKKKKGISRHNRPVRICMARQMPTRNLKFHQAEMFEAVDRSIRELLIIFSKG